MHPIAAVQTEYSLLYRAEAEETRDHERTGDQLRRLCAAGARLPDRGDQDFADVDGRRAAHPRFQEQNFAQNRALVAKIEAIAAEKGCTPAQLDPGVAAGSGRDVVAIPGPAMRHVSTRTWARWM